MVTFCVSMELLVCKVSCVRVLLVIQETNVISPLVCFLQICEYHFALS